MGLHKKVYTYTLFLFILACGVCSCDLHFADAADLVNGYLEDVVVQSDGKIVIVGNFTSYNGASIKNIARLNLDGTLDSTFNSGISANSLINTVSVQSDGKIIIGGQFTSYNGTTRNRIARINTDGSLDMTFDPGSGVGGLYVNDIAIQSDGKIVIVGDFTSYNGVAKKHITRINSDGSLDTSFNIGVGADDYIYGVAVQSDNKIIIVGNFYKYNNTDRYKIARINATGSLDTSFNPGYTLSARADVIAIQPDGKIVVGGVSGKHITRFNTNGSVDTAFNNSGTGANFNVDSVILQPDGKIIIGGQFTSYNGTTRNRIARINTDGSLDMTFDPGTGTNHDVYSSAIQADGKIIFGGYFTTYNDIERNRIVRVNSDGSNDPTFGFIPQTPSLTTSTASNIDQWNATLSGNITDIGQDNPERMIQLTTTSNNYTSPSECTAGTGGTGSYSCILSNLTPNTTYYYRAKATNSAGTSYGEEASFTTLQLEDTTIQDPTASDMTSAVNDGYFTLNSGSITDTNSVTTSVNITVEDTIFQAVFPTNTQISGDGSFNFQNFTATNVSQTVKDDQPTSRAAIRLGIPNEQLTFSQDITITVQVPLSFNNHTLDILYQQEGESTWHTHGTCTVTNGTCTFTTDHATIYTINGIHQATGDAPLNINTNVQATLSMDCYDPTDNNTTVQLGTTTTPGTVTAGTPAVGTSRCDVTTNDDQGYYLTLTDTNATYTTLTHTDPNTSTIYEIQDLTPYTEATPNIQTWNAPTTKGLGFSVIHFPDTNTAHNTFDGLWEETDACPEGTNPDTNNYTGIPQTPETIAAVTSYHANTTTTDLCYKVDVPASQPSGQYTGIITFTATSDASGYWQ